MEERDVFILKLKENQKSNQIYDFVKENGIIKINKEEFFNKILKDTKSEKYMTEIILSEKEFINVKNSSFNKNIYDEEVLGIIFILFFLLFILRYIIYGTKWSIKQLKE